MIVCRATVPDIFEVIERKAISRLEGIGLEKAILRDTEELVLDLSEAIEAIRVVKTKNCQEVRALASKTTKNQKKSSFALSLRLEPWPLEYPSMTTLPLGETSLPPL